MQKLIPVQNPAIASTALPTVLFVLAAGSLLMASLHAAEMRFQHFTIADPLPGKLGGTAGIPLADLDGDGDLDCALSRKDAHGFWWYERRTDAVWVQHLISDSPDIYQGLGAAALDVDGDGWTDLVFNQAWFKNPGTLRETPDRAWAVHEYEHSGHEVHDIMAADINGNGRPDIVTFDGKKLLWFDTAHSLAVTTVAEGIGHHGGLTPKGAGDLDGDGDLDLVIAGSWFENPGKGVGQWARHSWPHLVITNASYGTSARTWVMDLDRDGQNDIVYSDCDTGSSHVYWVKNEGKRTKWTRFPLPDPPTSPGNVPGTGSFHSLGVADFDKDGDLDIFAGEQEDPSAFAHWAKQGKLPMKAKGLKERGVIWINSGSKPPTFTPQVIQEDNPGWHDACLGDVDGDGDIDIVTKIWQKDGPTYHADYWRNDSVAGKQSAAAPPVQAQKLTLVEARARIPKREVPVFWLGGDKGLAERWNRLVLGKVQTVAVSPGGRPLHLISYGEFESLPQDANFNSADGARQPSAYRDKAARNKPVVLLVGPVHGEVEGLTGLGNFIQIMETGKDLRGKAQPQTLALGQRCRLLIIPSGNPDGLARFEPRMLHEMELQDVQFWGQGTWNDDTLCGWPGVKRVHPMVGSRVGFLGCYFNDAGVNPMHDEFFAPMSSEASAILRVAREEAPDCAVSLHSHDYAPEVLRPAYLPLEVQEQISRLAERYSKRLASLGLPNKAPFKTKPDGGNPPPAFNLTSALYHISGAVAFTFECPHSLREERSCRVTPDQILDIQLALYESVMEHVLESKTHQATK